jgi:multiple sugar transport system substrate-binding protein
MHAPRRLITTLIALLIASPLSSSLAQGSVTIYGLVNDAFARIWQDQLVAEFQREHPNIQVVIDGVPYGDQLPRQMLEITSRPPNYDFFVTDDPWLPQLASTGLLANVRTDLGVDQDAEYDLDDFFPGALAAGAWNGEQYAIPVRSNLLLMFYNRDLFEAAGVDEPGDDYSWDDLMADLPRLVRDTNGDGSPDVWGIATYFGRDQLTPTIWQAILNSHGGALFDEDLNPTFNTDVGVAALEMHIAMTEFGPPGARTYGFTDTLEAFRQGRVAVMFNWGSVFQGTAVNPATTTLTPDIVGIAPLPGGSEVPRSSHRGIWTGAVLDTSPNKDAAWTFLRWVTSREGERWAGANIGQFPARASTLASEPAQDWLVPVYAAIEAGYEAIGQGGMWRPRLPESDGVQRILALHHSRAMNDEVSAERALSDAEAEIRQFLRDAGYDVR